MGTFLGYLPNPVAAILILVLGSAGGQVAARAVAASAESSGIALGFGLSFGLGSKEATTNILAGSTPAR